MSTATDVESIEDVDFDEDVPCESWVCDDDHPADWYVISHCAGVLAMCQTAVDRRARMAGTLRVCPACFEVWLVTAYRVLGPVKP